MRRSVRAEHFILISAVFFAAIAIALHYRYLFWDFCAYKLSGDYLLGISHRYFEMFRPPAMPILLASLGTVGYFVLAEVLLAVAAILFARRFSFNPIIFYFLVQAPAAAVFSVTEGSEVLALAFGLLTLALYDSPLAGIFLGLAFLTRYSMVLYALPLLYLAWRHYRSQPRLLIYQAFAFLLVLAPWLAYNYVHFGNPLASMLDFTFLNGPAREYMWHWPDLSFLFVLIPTILLAIPTSRRHWVWWGFAAIILLVYLVTPFRAVRYVVPALPFLAIPATENLQTSSARKQLTVFVVIASLLGSLAVAGTVRGVDPQPFVSAAYALGNCTAVSNAWVPLACVGAHAKPLITPEDLSDHALVAFPSYPLPTWYSGKDPYAVAAYPGKDYNLYVPAHCMVDENYVGAYLDTYNRLKGTRLTYGDVLLCILHLRSC
ncbi:MAG: hypothetical protein GXN93_04605 [Candidatus Diapherotrites archaeon]|nr:hypothetical protein [Candidatus Diapherotrites archaeon]